MSYETREGSVDQGRPVEAYLISGVFGTYRYTDADEEVTIGGRVYKPVLIERGEYSLSSITDSLKVVNLVAPQDSKLAVDYGNVDTPDRFSVKIFRAHRGDDWATDFKQVWQGIGYGYSFDGRYFTVATVSESQLQLARQVDQTKFQLKCNHQLYDERCQVPQGANRSDTSVVSVAATQITVSASAWPNGDLVHGRLVSRVSWESRAILANVGNVITVDRRFLRMTAGDEVRLIRGCNKTFERCEKGFNNTVHFGGFPFKPEKLKIIKVGVGDLPGPKVEILREETDFTGGWPTNETTG